MMAGMSQTTITALIIMRFRGFRIMGANFSRKKASTGSRLSSAIVLVLAANARSVGVGVDVLLIMGAFALVTFGFLISGGRTQRWEGAVLLAGYAAYVVWLVL